MITSLLWLDDDERLLDASAPVFLKHGFRIHKATTVSSALSILEQTKVDGALLDKRLAGGEDGMELANVLIRQYPKLRVAIFTAFPRYDEFVTAPAAGAVAYLPKIDKSIPADPESQAQFFQALHRIFDGYERVSAGSRPVEEVLTQKPQPDVYTPKLFLTALVFIAVLFAVAATLWFLAYHVAAYVLPLTLVAFAVLYTVVSATIMRTRGDLSDRSFLRLMLASLRLTERGGKPPQGKHARKQNSKGG